MAFLSCDIISRLGVKDSTYIQRYLSFLSFSGAIANMTRDPMALAATVVYAACLRTGERKRQMDIANAADTTEVTIRNRFKELKNRLELDR